MMQIKKNELYKISCCFFVVDDIRTQWENTESIIIFGRGGGEDICKLPKFSN